MEASSLHPPGADRREPTQFSNESTELFRGENLEANEISLDAEKSFSSFAKRENSDLLISLSPFQRARHLYAIGRTGSGKSTMLERIVIADINAGKPGLFLDPHGESALRILDSVQGTRKICYADFSDTHYALKYNPVAGIPLQNAAKAANDIISAIKDIFFERDFNAPRFTHYFRHHLIPLIERGDGTLKDLLRMLSDKDYRDGATSDITDQLSREFWRSKSGEYAQADKKYNREAVAPIANKLSQILSSPNVRNVLDSRRPALNLKTAFREGYFVVVNLAKGVIGDDAASFMGSLFIADANNVLMARQPDECVPTSIVCDEFQNYAPHVLSDMLAEIRKKGGELTLAHQFATQIDERIFDAIMGNAGTIISFQVSPKDARLLAPQFDTNPQRPFSPNALTSLEPFHAIMRTSDIERIVTLPPPAPTGRAASLIRASQERFARKV